MLRHVAAAVSKLPDSSEEVAADVKPVQGASLTKEDIMQAQANYEFCQQVSWVLSEGKKLPYFRYKDSVLYHGTSNPSEGAKVVVPASLREQIIRQHHDPVCRTPRGKEDNK